MYRYIYRIYHARISKEYHSDYNLDEYPDVNGYKDNPSYYPPILYVSH